MKQERSPQFSYGAFVRANFDKHPKAMKILRKGVGKRLREWRGAQRPSVPRDPYGRD
jgi:hypothetical protein